MLHMVAPGWKFVRNKIHLTYYMEGCAIFITTEMSLKYSLPLNSQLVAHISRQNKLQRVKYQRLGKFLPLKTEV